VFILFFVKQSLTKTDRCAGALSSRRNQLFFSIFRPKETKYVNAHFFITVVMSVKYLFVCLLSWRYNPLWLYFPQPSSGL
jgi:hypothetical protein